MLADEDDDKVYPHPTHPPPFFAYPPGSMRVDWDAPAINSTRNDIDEDDLYNILQFRTVAVWTIIVASALLWCLIAICYRRKRARDLQMELRRRQAMREEHEQRLVERARLQRNQDHRQAFVDRNSRGSVVGGNECDEMLTISVSLARIPSYTPEYNPPTYNEAILDTGEQPPNAIEVPSDTSLDMPPSYSSIFSNDPVGNRPLV